MEKRLFILMAICGFLGYTPTVYAQTPKPVFKEGWYRILNGKKALEVVDSKKYPIRLARKSNSAKQLWKLTRIDEDQYAVYYRLTNQWTGETKALTVGEAEEGISLNMMHVYGKGDDVKDITNQTWVIMYADEAAQEKGNYVLLCLTPMSHLTYEGGKFILDYHEKTQPNQIWKFVPVE